MIILVVDIGAGLGDLVLWIFSPIGLVIIGSIVAVYVGFIYFSKREGKFKRKSLEKEVLDEMKNTINTTGVSQSNRFLRKGYVVIGKIHKIANLNFYSVKGNPHPDATKISKIKNPASEEKLLKAKAEGKDIDKFDFLEITITGHSLVDRILNWFGTGYKFFLVDKKAVKNPEENSDVVLDDDASFYKFGGVNVFSEAGADYVSDIAFKRIYQTNLEEQMNFLPLQTFLQIAQAGKVARSRELADLMSKRQKGFVESLGEEMETESD